MLDPKASRFWQATVLSGLMDAQGSDRLLERDSTGETRRSGAHRPSVGTAGGPVARP